MNLSLIRSMVIHFSTSGRGLGETEGRRVWQSYAKVYSMNLPRSFSFACVVKHMYRKINHFNHF